MDKIIEIITSLKPGVKVDANSRLLDDKIIESLSIMALVSELNDEFDVEIGPKDLVPENFATPADIAALISRLEDED